MLGVKRTLYRSEPILLRRMAVRGVAETGMWSAGIVARVGTEPPRGGAQRRRGPTPRCAALRGVATHRAS